LLIPHLSGFKAAYPDIDLILGVSDHRVDLLGEGVDLVLRLGPLSVMYPDRQYLAPQTRAFIDWTIAFSKIWTVRGSGRSEAGSWPKRKHQWVILSGRGCQRDQTEGLFVLLHPVLNGMARRSILRILGGTNAF
jgi:hypothetical protein